MAGAIGIALICVVVVPALVWVGYGLVAWALSHLLTDRGEALHPGSDLIETNV